MKYIFSNETVGIINSTLGVVSTKESTTVLSLGAEDLGETVKCNATVTSAGEQISLNFASKKPEEWAPVKVGVKSSDLSAACSSLLSFGEEIYLDVTDGQVTVGVSDKANVRLDTLDIPQQMEGENELMIVMMTASDFNSFLKKGLQSGVNQPSSDGTGNAVMVIDATNGEIRGFSTNKVLTSKSKSTVNFPVAPEGDEGLKARIEAMDKALDEYCEKNSREKSAIPIVLPISCVNHMKNLTASQSEVILTVTEKYVSVALGNVGTYTFQQGAQAPVAEQILDTVIEQESGEATRLQFDATALINAVTFINEMDKIGNGAGKNAIRLTVADGKLKIASATGNKAGTSLAPVAAEGADKEMLVNGLFLRDAINVLDKGNLVISFGKRTVMVQNGSLKDGISDAGIAFIMVINSVPDTNTAAKEE